MIKDTKQGDQTLMMIWQTTKKQLIITIVLNNSIPDDEYGKG